VILPRRSAASVAWTAKVPGHDGATAAVIQLRTNDVVATQAVAGVLASMVSGGEVIVLSGDLGAGKTAFTQGFGAALGVDERITSPTFTLVHEYVGRLALHHVDVYRLEDSSEVFDLALPEMLDDGGVTVIEWGNLIIPELPRDYLDIRISLGEVSEGLDVRYLSVATVGASWSARSDELTAALMDWAVGPV
jgi:tRNA threonylcarbamoyladenosine biosynthesis protein TsaE